MNVTSILRLLNTKKFLFAAILIFFLPFIIFSFWNVPSADDYMILDKREKYSFWGLQSWVYHTWTGRYFSTFVSTAFSYSGFLYSHYYVHTILLLLFTVFSWLFCVKQVNKYCLNGALSNSSAVLLSLVMLTMQINIIPEPVTAFYWFSSAITYQLPLILLILLTGVIVRLFSNPANRKADVIAACLLIVSLAGCNEVISLFVLVSSTILIGYYFFARSKIPAFVTSLYILNIASSCFLLFAPGILYRGSVIDKSPVTTIISITFFKFAALNWFFLKQPLWWFSVLFATLFFLQNRRLSEQVFKGLKKVSLSAMLSFYVLSGLSVYFPILYVSNGSFPLRSENIFCFLYSLIMLVIITVFFYRKTNNISTSVSTSFLYQYRYLLFSILIFSTDNMKKVSDTLLSGFFYKHVMQERLSLFQNAKLKQADEVIFDDYATAAYKQMKERCPVLDRKILKDIILKPPPVICFESDLYDINYLKEFYGIHKLTIRKN